MALRLTNLRSRDDLALVRALQFLLENPDDGVRRRSPELLERARDTGLGLIVEDDSRICGISLVFPYDGASRRYTEIGSMRITANGLGLQTFLARFHLLQIRLEEWTETPPTAFAVVTPGTASEHNLSTAVGMSNWSPPSDLETLRKTAGAPFDPAKRTLIAPHEAFAAAQAGLKSAHHTDKLFKTPKGDGQIEADLGWFSADLLDIDLSAGD